MKAQCIRPCSGKGHLNYTWHCHKLTATAESLMNALLVFFVFSVLSVTLRVLLLYAALRDHRIELVRASWQELTIRIGDVSLSDEGQYTCSLFTMPVKTTKAFLTVLGEHVRFSAVSTGQLLVANSSRSDSMKTCMIWIIVCRFPSPGPIFASCFTIFYLNKGWQSCTFI